MLPNMTSVCLLLLVSLTSVIGEGHAAEQGSVQQPALYVDVDIAKNPLSEEWPDEMCAGSIDINGCIDKIEKERIQKIPKEARKKKLKAKWKARKAKWQQRIDKLRKMLRERQSKGSPKTTNETTWAWKMLQAILKGRKTIRQVKKTIGKQKLRKMKSKKRKGKRWAWRMLLALLEGRKTILQVREAIKKQKVKKLQSQAGEEVNEEKTVEEADHLEKMEEEECKGVADREACKKEMGKINDGKRTTWAWKMLQAILKGKKTMAQVKKTIGKQKFRQMKSKRRKGKRWAWKMLLALLEGRKTISQVREAIIKQKLKKLQSQDGEDVNKEKTVEEADQLEKLEEEECKGVADREACKKKMEKINDGKKTTWAWKMLQAIMKGKQTIEQVKKTIGKQKMRHMKSKRCKRKRWAWRMLLALLEGRKTISQVRDAIKKQKLNKLHSQNEEGVNEEKTVEEADHLEKLEEEECKGVADSEACKKKMEKINDGKKTTWAWKMLQAILNGTKTIAQVKKTIGKEKLSQMKSEKQRRNRWAWRMLLALLEGRKTISQVREKLQQQKLKKLQSQTGEEDNEEKTVEEADHLEKLEEEECKGVADTEACKQNMEKINDGDKTTWAWKMLQAIMKGKKSIAQVKKTIGKQKLRKMRSAKRKGKRWAWRMLLALLEGKKTVLQVREKIRQQKIKKLQSQNGDEVNEEKTVEEADHLEKLEEEECKGVANSEACKKEMEKINDGEKTTWAWKMLQTIMKGKISLAQVKKTIGKQKLRHMKSDKRQKKRWELRLLLAMLEGTKTIPEAREVIQKQKRKAEETAEEADILVKLEEEECKGVADSDACKKKMKKINGGEKTTWAWKMLQTIMKGKKSIAQVKKTIGKQKLRKMRSEKRKGKRWAWRMLLALLEGRKTILQVREAIKKQKVKKLQSQTGEEANEEKTVEEADHLEKLEEEECKGIAESEACKKEMEKINDGEKTTWAWKMLQTIMKGKKSIAQVKKTLGKQKLKKMRSAKRKGKRWAWRMLLALLEGRKTILQVREAIKKQKVKKLQSQTGEEANEEKTVEEADHLEKLEEEECKGVAESEACKKEMEKINDGEKTTWAWKMLQTIMQGKKSIAEVKKTIGKQKLSKMRSAKRKGKRWAWRMLLALLEGRKTVLQVRDAIKRQKFKKLQSQIGEEAIEEKTVEEADHLEKLEEEECKGVADSEACIKEMEKINDGEKTTWAWKMLQTIMKGKKSIAQVKKTLGKQKLSKMRSTKKKEKRWAWRMLLALLEGRKTISQVGEAIKRQRVKKLQSQTGEEANEEKTVEEADHLEKLEEEECTGVADSEACKKEMEKINDGEKTTWAWKMLQTIMKGKKSIAEVKKTIGKQKLRKMRSAKRKGKRWAWRMLLALLEGRKTVLEVREAIKMQKVKKLQSQTGGEANEEKTVEEAEHLEKLEEEECKGIADSEACKKEMENINDGEKTTWAWKMLQTIMKGKKSIAEVKKTIGKQKLRKMRSEKRKGNRWAWRMLLALLEGRKTISQVREAIKRQKVKKLQSQTGEEANEEKTVEEADHLEKLEEEECKDVADSEACIKEMGKINDGEKTTWAWKMLQTIMKGKKSIAQVKKTIGKQKFRKMRSAKRKGKRWAWRMLLAILEGRKTILQVREAIKKQKFKKLQSQTGDEVNEEQTVEEADHLEKLEEEECKGVADSEACKKEMEKINDGEKTTWAWKMLQTVMKGEKSIAQVKKTIGKQKLRKMRSAKRKGKRWAWRMLLAILEGRKTILQVREAIKRQKFKKLQSQTGEEANEEKTVEEAEHLEKLEQEECKGVPADSEACKKEMEKINDGEKTTWAWKMLQTIMKGKKSIAQVKKTLGKQKLSKMRSAKRKGKRWAWRMLLALLEGRKTILQVREAIKRQKMKKLQSQTGEEVNGEKTVEEADHLEKLEEEECKGVADSKACKKEMEKINDGEKTTWAWKMLQTIMKGKKSIAQVKKTLGKQKLSKMRSTKRKGKRWAWRMLLALLEGRKTILQVREAIKKQKVKKLQSQTGEEVNEEKTVEEADHLEKLEEEECKSVADSEACKKEMEKINDGEKTTWAWKMLQTIMKGKKSIAEVKKTIGKQKFRKMRSAKRKGKRWAWRMLLALLEGRKTILQVREAIKRQKVKKLQSQTGEEVNEEKTVEEADHLEKLEEEECKGVADSEACKKEMEKINDGEKTTWAWKMLQTIMKGKKSIAEVKKTIGKQKLRKMRSAKRKGKRWAWRMLLALLEGRKTILQVREAIKRQKVKKLQSQTGEEVNEEKTVEEADHLEKLEEEECKGVADSEACKVEMEKINDGKKTTWAWKMLQTIMKGRKSIAEVKKTIGKQKLRKMRSAKRKGKRWAWRMLLALLEGRKTILQVREAIKRQKVKKLQSQTGEEANEEKTVEEADHLENLEKVECKGVADGEACKKEMEKINDGEKTTWAWKMLQTIMKGKKSIAEVKKTIGKQKLRKMRSAKRKGKRWAWRMLLALLEGRKTVLQVREAIKTQKVKKLQSQTGEEVNEEKTVEEADHLEKLEEEECKGVADREACKKEMEKINDGEKTTWAWKMLQTVMKGKKSIAEVKKTIGKQKLRKMRSAKRKGKRWAWRMLLALLEGSKTVLQVREAIKRQKFKKLQSQTGEEANEEKTVEEAEHLEKLEEEECKGVVDSEACKKEMEEINDGKKTTWAWKMLLIILKGEKTIGQVKKTIGKKKVRRMKAEKGKRKRWAWRMLLALLEGRKTILQVREKLGEERFKKLLSQNEEGVSEETTVEEAVHLKNLEEEECKGVTDSEGCKKEMEEINNGGKTTWAWKMLQAIMKGTQSIAQVKKTIGKRKLRQMKSERGRRKRWSWRMLLALLEGKKTISQVRNLKVTSETEAEIAEECKGSSNVVACVKKSKKAKSGRKKKSSVGNIFKKFVNKLRGKKKNSARGKRRN